MIKVVLYMLKDGQPHGFPLTEPTTVIGRRPDCGLRVATGDVSRQHCRMVIEGRSVLVKDLGSANGTFVNGKRIAETKLNPGDRLGVGPAVFVVQIEDKPPKITPENFLLPAGAKAGPAVEAAGAGAAAAVAGAAAAKPAAKKPAEEDVFEIEDEDFDLDEHMASLMDDDEDE